MADTLYFQASTPFAINTAYNGLRNLLYKMATEATFTIRQVESNQPEVEPAEPPAKTTERPEQRKSVRRKKKKDKEEKKKTKKPPGYFT